MKKRILSIVLTVIMLLSVIPLPALAAEQSEPVNLGSTAFARMCKGTCPSGEGIQNVFDGDRSTKWCMFGSGWMFFTLPDPALIQYMRICHAGSNPTETAPYNTVAFDLEVLDESKLSEESMREAQYRRSLIENDGLWTKVASVTGNGADITNTAVSMTESRTMFRLNVTDAGEDDTVRIYEVELFDTVPDRFEVHMDSAQASVDGKPVTSARPGEIVTVTADNAGSPDQYFHQWETSPENLVLSAPFSDVTTFIMPESDVTVKAHYSTDNTMYNIIVDNGTANVHGTPVTAAPRGVDVTLIADDAPEGQAFDHWESVDPSVFISYDYSPVVTIKMTRFDLHLKPVYKDAITQVSISDLTLPKRGANPDFEVTIPQDAPYHLATSEELSDHGYSGEALMFSQNGISWRERVWEHYLTEGNVFDDAREGAYYAQISVLPNEGYTFAENVAVTINDSDSLIGKVQFKRNMLSVDTKPLTADLADPTERAVTVEGGTATVYGETVTTAPGGVFVKLTADPAPEGQSFSYWEVISGNITVEARPSYTFMMPTEPVHVRAVYGKTITEVSVSDLTLPVLGATPDLEVTIPSDAPYHLATPDEMERAGKPRDNQAMLWAHNGSFAVMEPGETFYKPDQDSYYARIVLAPDEGYAFTEKTVATINGRSDLVDHDWNEYLLYIILNDMTAAPGPVMDYSVEVEGGTASVDGTAVTSVRAGSTVTLTADPVPEGQIFLRWEVLSGHSSLADPKALSTTFTMYAEDIRVKAVFATPIEKADIIDLTMPVVGAHPDFDVTVPENAPYHLPSREEMAANGFINVDTSYDGIWWRYNDSNDAMGPEDVFGPDAQDYYATIVLAPNDGYIFTDAVPVTINGDNDLVKNVMAVWSGYIYINTLCTPAAAAPVTEYAVTVEGGTATVDGKPVTTAHADTTVTLTADSAPAGKVFDHWNVISGEITLADAGAASTTFTMLAGPVHVKAVYAHDYTITVESGTASVAGTAVTAAFAGDTVTLSAAPAPEGKIFDRWEAVSGEITLTDARAASTTFTMPAKDVAVKAVYKDVPSVQKDVQIEFIKETLFGQRVTERTVPVDGSLRIPAPGGLSWNERCWLSEDGSTVLLKGDRIDYTSAKTLQSAAADGVLRFRNVLRSELPSCELTVLFLDGQKEVGRTSVRTRLDERTVSCLCVQPHLPSGYVFADNQDQSIRNKTVTFQVAPLAEDCGPLQLTLKMGFGFWRLENGQKTMTVTLKRGESFTLPNAQNRRGTTVNVCWSVNGENIQMWNGHSISYEELAQFLSILTDGGDELCLRGKADRT